MDFEQYIYFAYVEGIYINFLNKLMLENAIKIRTSQIILFL